MGGRRRTEAKQAARGGSSACATSTQETYPSRRTTDWCCAPGCVIFFPFQIPPCRLTPAFLSHFVFSPSLSGLKTGLQRAEHPRGAHAREGARERVPRASVPFVWLPAALGRGARGREARRRRPAPGGCRARRRWRQVRARVRRLIPFGEEERRALTTASSFFLTLCTCKRPSL